MVEKIYDEVLNETLYKFVHKSGLTIYSIPKKEHSKSYATLATNYGSIINEFKVDGDEEITKIPDGVAHFLEHKLFEQPDGTNAFDDYSKTGASANAFTSFNSTVYLFSCTDKFYENLDILVNFVTHPYFTDENIAKEQGIIGQEIKMYDDDPNWRVFFNMLDGMYVNHTIKRDIAGSIETISHITKDTLYKCYNTFYHPSNMVLVTCGDVEIEKVIEIADKYFDNDPIGKVTIFNKQEPANISKPLIKQKLSVSMPLFSIGYKDNSVGYNGKKMLKKEIVTSIILEMLLGDGSKLYNKLYDMGLINDSFDTAYECEESYGFSQIVGESSDPYKVKEIIDDTFSNISFNEEEFLRAKKVQYGDFLRVWNSVEGLTNTMVSELFRNINIFDFSKIYQEITFDDIKTRFDEHFKKENSVLSVIEAF